MPEENKQVHTPGPWEVEQGINLCWGVVDPHTKNEICRLYNCREDPLYNSEANSKLIAAAPELLYACRALLYHCQVNQLQSTAHDENYAIRAINKATGVANEQ